MRNLKWLVVADLFETETAQVWKEPGVDPQAARREVFFIPAAPAAEKDGSLTNTMRLVQWHGVPVAAATRVRTRPSSSILKPAEASVFGSTARKDRPILDLTWDYRPEGAKQEPDMERVLREINGFATRDVPAGDGRPRDRAAPHIVCPLDGRRRHRLPATGS